MIMIDILKDTLLDNIKMLPFLFTAFLIIESVEHRSSLFVNRIIRHSGKGGPLLGALLGCFPQCGFSVLASNLYAGRIITVGTLLSVFLATSDEAVLILLGNPGYGPEILRLLAVKIVIGITAGYLIDLLVTQKQEPLSHIHHMCRDCGCQHHHGILRPALHHTLKIFCYLLIFSGILNFAIKLLGTDRLSAFLMSGSWLQPIITALFGLIPNCAVSVILTTLYLNGAISFASVVAGLCSGAGLGLVVLFKMNDNRRENLQILGLLYTISAFAGVLLSLFC